MTPSKPGQIVKICSSIKHTEPHQQYVVLSIYDGSKAKIGALSTGLPSPPTSIVNLIDLEVVEVQTKDLIGQNVYIKTNYNEKILGKVVSTEKDFIYLDMDTITDGVHTNVLVTIVDKNGQEFTGSLFITG